MGDVAIWFNSLPQFTRYWFGGTVAVSLLGRFGLLPIQYLILAYTPFIEQFQIWRPITALFFYPISPQTGFHFLINLYFLVNYSKLLENGEFAQRPADYLFMLLINWTTSVIAALFMNMMFLMDPMVLSVLYIWCNLNGNQIVNFWFGTQFQAKYLPWVLFGFNMIISGGGMSELMGILIGHFYFFLMYQYPQQYGGRPLLSTPSFLESYFPPRQGGQGGFGIPPAFRQPAAAAAGAGPQGGQAPPPQRPAGHRWGTGRPLGN